MKLSKFLLLILLATFVVTATSVVNNEAMANPIQATVANQGTNMTATMDLLAVNQPTKTVGSLELTVNATATDTPEVANATAMNSYSWTKTVHVENGVVHADIVSSVASANATFTSDGPLNGAPRKFVSTGTINAFAK